MVVVSVLVSDLLSHLRVLPKKTAVLLPEQFCKQIIYMCVTFPVTVLIFKNEDKPWPKCQQEVLRHKYHDRIIIGAELKCRRVQNHLRVM
jgi:hypothetical protein